MKVYEIITNRIVELLEKGTIPWRKPWAGEEAMPRNAVSSKPYRGINAFLLSACSSYASPNWLTFKQALDLGGSVRKGEHGMPVVFWTEWEKEDKETGDKEKIPVLRYYTVFNAVQCEGIPAELTAVPESDRHPFEAIEAAQAIVGQLPAGSAAIEHGHLKAAYSPSRDVVVMPDPERFEIPAEYYSVLFHELTHSTGHGSRLDRKGITEAIVFGSERYAHEELVAEMGAAFLCGHAGIDTATIENSAAYVANWIRVLKGNPRMAVMAAAQAQKAADWLLCRTLVNQEKA